MAQRERNAGETGNGRLDPTDQSSTFFKTTKGRLTGAAAVLVGIGAVINGFWDVVKAAQNAPSGVWEQTNDRLFKEHFHETPVVADSAEIKVKPNSVNMLLEVYENGDVHVSYVDLDQWFPFKKPSLKSTGWLMNDAIAQESPPSRNSQQVPLLQRQYNIEAIIQQKAHEAELEKNSHANEIRREFVIADILDQHNTFSTSTRDGEQTFRAEPGYRITSTNLMVSSSNNYQLIGIQKSEDGSQVTVRYRLRSGPLYDQWRGWIKATLQTSEERIR